MQPGRIGVAACPPEAEAEAEAEAGAEAEAEAEVAEGANLVLRGGAARSSSNAISYSSPNQTLYCAAVRLVMRRRTTWLSVKDVT